jgi:hypothetical protein
VKYEILVAVHMVPDLIEGEIEALRYLPMSSSLSPTSPPKRLFVDDITAKDKGGQERLFQAKQNQHEAQWSISRLLREKVFKAFLRQHQETPHALLFFVSNIPAPGLTTLADTAGKSCSAAEFYQVLTEQPRTDADQIIASLACSEQDLWEFLGKTRFLQLTLDMVSGRIRDYGTGRYPDVDKFAMTAKELVEELQGQIITRAKAVAYFQDKGLYCVSPALSRDIRQIMRQASGQLRLHGSDILAVHIPREETATIEEWLRSQKEICPVAFLLASQGEGKSVIMRDLLVSLELHAVPTLAIKADALGEISRPQELQGALGLPVTPEQALSALPSMVQQCSS